MFALSFYNLIPSCYECNSSLKGEKIDIENMPLNPYESDFDSLAKFVITFSPNAENIPNYSDINSFNIKIIANQQNKLVKNHCDFFELEERYRYRKLEASEILMKKFIDTPKMRREIANQLCLNNIPSSYMNLLLYGNYISSDMINKRPLSKLTQDIFNMKNLIIKK